LTAPARLLTVPEFSGPWPGYRGPDAEAVSVLHRHDGFLTVASKAGGKYRDLFAIPAGSEQLILPGFADELREDAFFSVHGMAVAGRRLVSVGAVSELRAALRISEYADYLTSAFLDCDCHKVGMTAGAALGRLMDAETAGTIPQVSFYLMSGRGVWPFWLLADESGRVPKTGGRERRLWAGIERALADRVRPLGVGLDEGVIDLARVCRLPGTINSKAGDGFGEEVRFSWMTDAENRVRFYVLDELADALGVVSWYSPPRIIQGGPVPGRARGWRALWEKRLAYLDALQLHRGGYWQEGHRNNALFVLAVCLRKTGHGDNLIRDTIERAGIASGLQAGEAAGIVRNIERLDRYKKFPDARIKEWVGLTDREAAAIGWDAPTRDWSEKTREKATANKAERIGKRRELVREYVRTVGGGWSVLTLQAWLDEKHGIRPGHRTLFLDLAALGIETPAQSAKNGPAPLSLFGGA